MVSILGLAIAGAVAVMGATSVANGDASAAIEAVKQVAPYGLHVALSHVPTWTHAHQVLEEHLSQYAQSGSAGGAAGTGVGAAVKKGLAKAVSKAVPLRH